jgi:hypothetical protein
MDMLTVRRFPENPIIRPNMDSDQGGQMGTNINGPSLIQVPEWLPNPLGRYYLYFGDHHGTYIRLAYADQLVGPWRIYAPGTLRLDQAPCHDHLASPDVHVDHQRRQIRMYYHGPVNPREQKSFVALSPDGIHFESGTEELGLSYFRVFQYGGWYYALGMPGIFYRSKDGMTGFEQGPTLFGSNMRHTALKREGDRLWVYYTNAGDCPESILRAAIDLKPDWLSWQTTDPQTVLQPETDYEGGNLPLEPSERGFIEIPVRQLRDPCIYEEDGRTYLIYAAAGESALAIAEIN